MGAYRDILLFIYEDELPVFEVEEVGISSVAVLRSRSKHTSC